LGEETLDNAAYPDQLLLVLSRSFIIGPECPTIGPELLSANAWNIGVDPNKDATNIAGTASAAVLDLRFKKDIEFLKNLVLESYMHFVRNVSPLQFLVLDKHQVWANRLNAD